jgi:hypothetical protein
MADHSKPLLTSTYANFVSELDARLDDLATGLDPAVSTVTNQPVNTIRWNSVSKKWQKYNGSAWNDLSGTYDITLQTDRSNFNSVETSVLKSKNATTAMSIADSTGVVTFSANPILNSGVANGVPYLNGSKVLTSGSALTFDGTKLGIGTTTPEYKLDVSGGADIMARFNRTSTDGNVIQIEKDGNTNGYIGTASGFSLFLNSTGTMQFQVAGSEQMRLTSTGLGIGTSSPGEKLSVVTIPVAPSVSATSARFGTGIDTWDLRIVNGIDGGGLGYVRFAGPTVGGYFGFEVNNSEQMRLTSTGLGIGTSSPGDKLTVASGRIRLDQDYQIVWQNAGTNRARLYGDSSSNLIFEIGSSNTERMRIDSSGNLGLGVVPSAWWSNDKALQVLGGAIWAYNGDTANINLSANAYQNASNVAMYIGAGTATRYAQETGAHKWFTAPSGTAGNAISFTQAMTLDASGNLGINKTNPTEKLDVNGNIKSSGSIKSESGGFIFPDGTTQTTAATTPTVTAGAVGTYAFLYPASAITLAAGGTAAGSTLRYGPNSSGTSAPSGTWMLMGNLSSSTSASLWYRVS